MSKKIAICKNDLIFKHSEMWTDTWISYCERNKLNYEIVDCYAYDISQKLRDFDLLLWHPQNYVLADMMEARNILTAAKQIGLKVFPDFNTFSHFDDKIAQMYLLQTVNAPIPKSWVFYLYPGCRKWLNHSAQYPLIAKLRCGSGSNNVKLLKTKKDALRYSKHSFWIGNKVAPSLLYKAKSKAQSSHDWKTAVNRIKRIPEFMNTLSRARLLPREQGYAYFQEFIPNDGYDLKVVVVGDKVSGFTRNTRKGDFRASGGGDLIYNNSLITKQVRDTAFYVNDQLQLQCMGYDFVVNKETKQGFIVEMSFGFSKNALLQVGGYWERSGKWHDEPLNAPEEVLKNLMKV